MFCYILLIILLLLFVYIFQTQLLLICILLGFSMCGLIEYLQKKFMNKICKFWFGKEAYSEKEFN